MVWFRTPWGLIHGYECCGGALWFYLNRLSTDGGSMPCFVPRYPPFILHGLITLKTVILNFNILHFPCRISLPCLLQTYQIHVLGNKLLLLLFYIIF